ncbi:hypothetical protein BS47DRAFT_1354090 [Hydnum rufescens UP504]|uniref:Uncharacterized protein n=1 Tax=Hydnum rufescens UP504 TaxID=1448309 RepID=A0A9P6DNH9_9AGAM|nr:hypothetical protein BS47DRAFT_1354090 [Hydnum rufescens UP504]
MICFGTSTPILFISRALGRGKIPSIGPFCLSRPLRPKISRQLSEYIRHDPPLVLNPNHDEDNNDTFTIRKGAIDFQNRNFYRPRAPSVVVNVKSLPPGETFQSLVDEVEKHPGIVDIKIPPPPTSEKRHRAILQLEFQTPLIAYNAVLHFGKGHAEHKSQNRITPSDSSHVVYRTYTKEDASQDEAKAALDRVIQNLPGVQIHSLKIENVRRGIQLVPGSKRFCLTGTIQFRADLSRRITKFDNLVKASDELENLSFHDKMTPIIIYYAVGAAGRKSDPSRRRES